MKNYQNGNANKVPLQCSKLLPFWLPWGKKNWGTKLEVAYSARDVFGGHVPSHSAFISLFMVFLKLR